MNSLDKPWNLQTLLMNSLACSLALGAAGLGLAIRSHDHHYRQLHTALIGELAHARIPHLSIGQGRHIAARREVNCASDEEARLRATDLLLLYQPPYDGAEVWLGDKRVAKVEPTAVIEDAIERRAARAS